MLNDVETVLLVDFKALYNSVLTTLCISISIVGVQFIVSFIVSGKKTGLNLSWL